MIPRPIPIQAQVQAAKAIDDSLLILGVQLRPRLNHIVCKENAAVPHSHEFSILIFLRMIIFVPV